MKAAGVLAGVSLGAILLATHAAASVAVTVTRETPTQVRLDWTGGQPPFSVYRAAVPSGLVSPGNLVTTVAGNTWTDVAATGTLLFYGVEAPSCTGDEQCQDGTVCNGVETCTAGSCQPGTPLGCDDGVACTADACHPTVGCTHVADSAQCPCGQTCDPLVGCAAACTVRDCAGQVLACGDCLDNDGDCRVDAADEHCLGACDNTEGSLHPGLLIPLSCTQDCFFDSNGGTGDDDCTWSQRCDPLEVPPDYPPGGSACAYSPATTVGGRTCTQMMSSQSALCLESCSGLTPNGCDYFGCCSIPGAPGPVWLGSVDAVGTPACTLADLNDPARCKPCTPVDSGTNACAHCELCVGKTTLPGDCPVQLCPVGVAGCGLPGQAPCPAGSYCVTGCCQPLPQ